MKYTNNSENDKTRDEFFEGAFIEIDGDFYKITTLQDTMAGFSIDGAYSWSTIESEDDAAYYVVATVPKDVLEKCENVKFYILLDGSAYTYTYNP
jgi:hypothetical protein